MTRQQLIIRIMNGADNMPAFAGILKPEELDNPLKFLATRTEPGKAAAVFVPDTGNSL